jgi:hypothetical protein
MQTFKKNLSKEEQLMRIGSGMLLLSYGIFRKRWVGLAGIIPIASGLMGYSPVKHVLETIINANENTNPVAISESNRQPIDGEEGSGGYRTGNPETGKTKTQESNFAITES